MPGLAEKTVGVFDGFAGLPRAGCADGLVSILPTRKLHLYVNIHILLVLLENSSESFNIT
jgi:hypothetical protein